MVNVFKISSPDDHTKEKSCIKSRVEKIYFVENIKRVLSVNLFNIGSLGNTKKQKSEIQNDFDNTKCLCIFVAAGVLKSGSIDGRKSWYIFLVHKQHKLCSVEAQPKPSDPSQAASEPSHCENRNALHCCEFRRSLCLAS